MSTETTKGAGDRSGCLWFCGMTGADIVADPRRLPSGVRCGVNWFTFDERCGDHDRRWCSRLCRDERRGPVAAAPTCSVVPGCQIRMAHDHGACDARFRYGDGGPDGACRLPAGHDGGHDMQRLRRPTPTETPSPAHTPATALPPTIPTGAVAGVGGPPDGYVPCRLSCGRWTPLMAETSNGDVCYHCLGNKGTTWLLDLDWTPPHGWKLALTPPPPVKETAPKLQRARPAGITCPRCLCTSEGGTHHLEACPRGDFLPRDAGLTSGEWSDRVSTALVFNKLSGLKAAQPFVPSIDDYDLFGKDVR